MRAYSRGLLAIIGVSLVLLGSTGCGSATARPRLLAASATAEIGNTINYGSFGTTADLDCADGKSLTIGGSNNTLTVTGTCTSVNVGGADNKITLDTVEQGHQRPSGLNNTVTYKNGDPKVNDVGSDNSIKKG